MAYTLDILNALKDANNGLLSKININGKTYEIKDLIARENIEDLAELLGALSDKVGNVADGQNLADIIKNIQESAYDDTALRNELTKLIGDSVADEAKIARAAEKANADEIARVNGVLVNALDNNADGLDSIKELATWINTHGAEAEGMSKAITKNAEDIAAMDKAYKAADEALDGRLDLVEAALGDGEGSVADQIADAVQEAKDYADDQIEAYDVTLGKLAKKDEVVGTVAGETISGIKATGQSAGSIQVTLNEVEEKGAVSGKFTPAGTVAGTVTIPQHDVAVSLTHAGTAATLSKGDYTPAGTVSADFSHASTAAELIKGEVTPTGSVSVALSGGSFNAITGVGSQASFTEGKFTPASLDSTDVTANYATEGIVGAVADECLTFTAAGIAAITATKVNEFVGGSKAADTFVANSLPTMAAHEVGVQSASFAGDAHEIITGVNYDKAALANLAFAGTKAEGLAVTGVTYDKASVGSASCAGQTVDIDAAFTGTEGNFKGEADIFAYRVQTAKFNPAAIELSVGDITVAEKSVTSK